MLNDGNKYFTIQPQTVLLFSLFKVEFRQYLGRKENI